MMLLLPKLRYLLHRVGYVREWEVCLNMLMTATKILNEGMEIWRYNVHTLYVVLGIGGTE